jgi:hypothetical protein
LEADCAKEKAMNETNSNYPETTWHMYFDELDRADFPDHPDDHFGTKVG